jgi:translin
MKKIMVNKHMLKIKIKFNPDKLEKIIDKIDKYLSERDLVRENAIKKARDVIKLSGWAITGVHKGDLEEAEKLLNNAEKAVQELLEMVKDYPELYYSGTIYNAVSEYVEARLFIDMIMGRELKGPEELGVQPVPYLQGLGDVVGELRRLALEVIRRDEFDVAWKALEAMEEIYFELRKLDYPDAIAPGIRHKADVARRLVDDTKALLIDLENRQKLSKNLEKFLKNDLKL